MSPQPPVQSRPAIVLTRSPWIPDMPASPNRNDLCHALLHTDRNPHHTHFSSQIRQVPINPFSPAHTLTRIPIRADTYKPETHNLVHPDSSVTVPSTPEPVCYPPSLVVSPPSPSQPSVTSHTGSLVYVPANSDASSSSPSQPPRANNPTAMYVESPTDTHTYQSVAALSPTTTVDHEDAGDTITAPTLRVTEPHHQRNISHTDDFAHLAYFEQLRDHVAASAQYMSDDMSPHTSPSSSSSTDTHDSATPIEVPVVNGVVINAPYGTSQALTFVQARQANLAPGVNPRSSGVHPVSETQAESAIDQGNAQMRDRREGKTSSVAYGSGNRDTHGTNPMGTANFARRRWNGDSGARVLQQLTYHLDGNVLQVRPDVDRLRREPPVRVMPADRDVTDTYNVRQRRIRRRVRAVDRKMPVDRHGAPRSFATQSSRQVFTPGYLSRRGAHLGNTTSSTEHASRLMALGADRDRSRRFEGDNGMPPAQRQQGPRDNVGRDTRNGPFRPNDRTGASSQDMRNPNK